MLHQPPAPPQQVHNEHAGQIAATFTDPNALTRKDQVRLNCVRQALDYYASNRQQGAAQASLDSIFNLADQVESWINR